MGARGELDDLWGQRDQAEPVEDRSRAPQDAFAAETSCCTHRLHADQLTRDLSEVDLRHLDARARALGISRSEYIRQAPAPGSRLEEAHAQRPAPLRRRPCRPGRPVRDGARMALSAEQDGPWLIDKSALVRLALPRHARLDRADRARLGARGGGHAARSRLLGPAQRSTCAQAQTVHCST